MNNLQLALDLIPLQTLNTIYMVLASTILAIVIGLPVGVVLMMTDQGGLKECRWVYKILGTIEAQAKSNKLSRLVSIWVHQHSSWKISLPAFCPGDQAICFECIRQASSENPLQIARSCRRSLVPSHGLLPPFEPMSCRSATRPSRA